MVVNYGVEYTLHEFFQNGEHPVKCLFQPKSIPILINNGNPKEGGTPS